MTLVDSDLLGENPAAVAYNVATGYTVTEVMQYRWCYKGQGRSRQIILPWSQHIKMKMDVPFR